MDKVNKTSMAINDERLKQLQALFPEAFSEGKVDFDKLRQTLGEHVDSRPERYSFTWAGKREAMQAAQIPSRATLIPDFDESVNFDETQNIFIEGDNLEVLKLLARPYFGRVKMIYIDPPYNTGNDFVYPDNYADPLHTYLRMTGQKNGNGDLLTTNAETNGRYHSAWLSMMYPRLLLARQMLRDDGVIFISIDDNEIHNLRQVMNEVFGENNFFGQIIIRANSRGQTYKQIAKTHEYLLIYTKNPDTELLELEKEGEKDDLDQSDNIGGFNLRELRNRNPKFGKHNRPNLYYPFYVNPEAPDESELLPVSLEKTPEYHLEVLPLNSTGKESCWRWGEKRSLSNINANTLESNLVAKMKTDGSYGIYEKYRKTTYKPKSIWTDNGFLTETGTVELRQLDLQDYFDFPKPVALIKQCIALATEDDDIVVDFFSGSATTAQALLELNREDGSYRRFILVQLPEKTKFDDLPTLAHVGRERVRRVIQKMQAEENGKLEGFEQHPDEDLGFRAFRLVETNYRPDPNPEGLSDEEYSKQMALWADSLLVDNWDAVNVIYEVALKEGYGLNIRVEEVSVEDNTVYRVTDPDREQSFSICLDDKLRPDIIDALGLKKDDLFICHDNALDDTLAANLALQARLQTL